MAVSGEFFIVIIASSACPCRRICAAAGNINQLVLRLKPYVAQLRKTDGLIGEFVNPKYKDSSRTAFKSATRLECMMQVGDLLLLSWASRFQRRCFCSGFKERKQTCESMHHMTSEITYSCIGIAPGA